MSASAKQNAPSARWFQGATLSLHRLNSGARYLNVQSAGCSSSIVAVETDQLLAPVADHDARRSLDRQAEFKEEVPHERRDEVCLRRATVEALQGFPFLLRQVRPIDAHGFPEFRPF